VLGHLLAEVAAAGVHHHPDDALWIDLRLDEVVAAAERTHLADRLVDLGEKHGHVGHVVEERGAIRLAHPVPLEAGRDRTLDVVEHRVPEPRELGERDVRIPRAHAAADIQPNRVRDDLPKGGEHPADGHAVAYVRIGHERHVLKRKRQPGEVACLLERTLVDVGAPDLDRKAFCRHLVHPGLRPEASSSSFEARA
jgi:hypothetical protein